MSPIAKFLCTVFWLSALPDATAEWEQCRLGYVWTGTKQPEITPKGHFQAEYYDYRRRPDGTYFVYSDEYEGGKRPRYNTSWRNRLIAAGYPDPEIGRSRKTAGDNPSDSPDTPGHFMKVMRECIEGRAETLRQYYKYPASCSISHFYLRPKRVHVPLDLRIIEGNRDKPNAIVESLAEYNLDNPLYHEDAWIVVCKGTVVAPENMTFRFVGTADDCLAVKFNNQLVLETGYRLASEYESNGRLDPAYNKSYSHNYLVQLSKQQIPGKEQYIIIPVSNVYESTKRFLGMTGGTPISVKKGLRYDIEIIYGNEGGQAHCYLFTQRVDDSTLHLFRTSDDSPYRPAANYMNHEKETGPDFSSTSPIWRLTPRNKEFIFNKKKKTKKDSGKKPFYKFKKL